MIFVPPADKIIHHFKYRKKTSLSKFLGRAMANLIRTDHHMKKADIIAPVPLFWWKYLKRGYNQAALLADTIASETHIRNIEVIRRIRMASKEKK
jgi:predicted amidophosphoribosyltransferase